MKHLGQVLWDIARAEGVAVSATRVLDRSGLLTEAEHRFIEERMHREEVQHRELMEWWARKLGPARPRQDGFHAMVSRDGLIMGALTHPQDRLAMTLATMLWNEENTLRAYPRWIGLFRQVDTDLARDFEQVLLEERGHVAFGRALVRRIERESPHLARRFGRFYGLTRRVYPVLIHRAMIGTQQRLKEMTQP